MALPPGDEGYVQTVRAAGDRLAERLHMREAQVVDGDLAVGHLPAWWRQGLARCRVFGDGLLSWPVAGQASFSRPVSLFSAREISVSAGGEFLPFAWLDGGARIAVVQERGLRPVAAVPPDGSSDGERLTDSLVDFLDALQPQTLCLLTSPAGRRRIEICGERTLLVERAGRIAPHTCASDDDMGRTIARFLSDAIDDGLQVISCPARMRPLIAGYSGLRMQASQVAPEVRAQRVIEHLLENELLELVETPASRTEAGRRELIEDLVDEVGRFLERENPRWSASGKPSGKFTRRFADWLAEHRLVEDLYADDATVAASFVLVSPS